MRLTMPTAVVEGTQLTVMPFRTDAVIGTMSVPALVQLVPSPRTEEDARRLKASSGLVRRHAELRSTVQRTLKSSQKGKNVGPYAEYIADGLKGDLGAGWSTPPITLWHAGPLAAIGDELVAGTGLRTLTVAAGTMVIAIDGETQTTAWHDLYDDPEAYGLTHAELAQVRIPFELYVDLAPADARQIFYDRNVQGVAVAKNLAMSMDQRDFGTRLAHRVAESVKVELDGKRVSFSQLVNASKRQVAQSDKEVVTLSALRALVVTTVYGRAGLSRSAETVHEDELPHDVSPEQVEQVVVPLLGRLRRVLPAPRGPQCSHRARRPRGCRHRRPPDDPLERPRHRTRSRRLRPASRRHPLGARSGVLGRRRRQNGLVRPPQLQWRREGLGRPGRRRDPLPGDGDGPQDPRTGLLIPPPRRPHPSSS
ncbi:DNA sulfur modification protein DndB [Streptomyces sp. E-08]|uniref:DNA sulfur modification protein DndB n=1 Tax=Streptomyces sp. E-08 TaxID=3404047 RepID=UPI003CFA1C4A